MSATTLQPRQFTLGLFNIAMFLIVFGVGVFLFGRALISAQFATEDDMAATRAMLTHVQMLTVICPKPDMSAADRQRWDAYVAAKRYTAYPQGGAGCVDP